MSLLLTFVRNIIVSNYTINALFSFYLCFLTIQRLFISIHFWFVFVQAVSYICLQMCSFVFGNVLFKCSQTLKRSSHKKNTIIRHLIFLVHCHDIRNWNIIVYVMCLTSYVSLFFFNLTLPTFLCESIRFVFFQYVYNFSQISMCCTIQFAIIVLF